MSVINIGRINQFFRKVSHSPSLCLQKLPSSTSLVAMPATKGNTIQDFQLYIHWYGYIINWCKTLRYPLSLPFLFLFPLPDSWSPFLSDYNSFGKIPISPAPFFCPKYITLFICLYTHSQRRTRKKNLHYPPPPSIPKKFSK